MIDKFQCLCTFFGCPVCARSNLQKSYNSTGLLLTKEFTFMQEDIL